MGKESQKKASSGRIAFVGGGNMAEALLRGLLEAGHAARTIQVAEPLAARRNVLRKSYGVRVTQSNLEAIADASTIVLAVKPQIIETALQGFADALGRRQLIVSIAAGVTLTRLERLLGPHSRVVRVMPNTPCLVGRGVSVLAAGSRVSRTEMNRVRTLFATVGKAHSVNDEGLLDAVTGLSGSGPAYVYLFAEALISGATRAGMDPSLAADLAYETLAGAAEMLISTGRTPQELRAAVTSPGGTTLAGLEVLEKGRFARTVAAAVAAATRRSRQLGRGRR